MKKLLSLLSVLTIGGTAVPTTIAASPYQKEENLNNNLILSHLNNNFLLDSSSKLISTGIKKINEINNYIIEKFEYFKNNAINFIKLNFLINEIKIDFEEIESLRNLQVYNIKFDYFKKNVYLLTTKGNHLYKFKENGNLQLIHSSNKNEPQSFIHGFSLDNKINRNIYIFEHNKLYKNNIYNIKEKISNLGFNYFYLDNEGNIIFHVLNNDIDFLNLIKNDEENIPQNIDDVYKLRKVYMPNKNYNYLNFNFDEYNNIYLKAWSSLYIIRKFDINPEKIAGGFSHDNYTGYNFYAIKDDIFIFSDKKFYHLKSGQTSVEEISIPNINDHYLDNKQENFYIATEKGIYKFNIIDQESNKISNIISSKISVDKSENIFIKTTDTNWYNLLLILLKKENGDYEEYKISYNEKIDTFEKIFNINKKFYLFTNTDNVFKVFYFNRLNEWINNEEKEQNEIEKKANKLEQERLDKERQEWMGEEGEKKAKEWKINKLKEVEEYLKKQKEQGKLSSLEEKILSCLSKHIADGFALGFGVLGGALGSAIAPGTGTVSGATIGTAIGKWLGGIIGDSIQEAVPGEKSCKF